MSVRQLLNVVSPPAGRSDVQYDWGVIERDIGFSLPSDYKGVVEAYGPGKFDDFIYVHQPNSADRYIDLSTENAGYLEAFRELAECGMGVSYDLSEPSQLLCCGREDNGNPIFWKRDGVDSPPDSWSIVVLEARGDQEFEYHGNLTDFLVAVLTRQVRVPVFPEDFPSSAPGFTALE